MVGMGVLQNDSSNVASVVGSFAMRGAELGERRRLTASVK